MIDKNIAEQIIKEINNAKLITICMHIEPDGDTIASAYALKELIKLNFKDKEVKVSGDTYPRYLSFIPKSDYVDDDFFNNSLKIVVDTSSIKRVFDKRVVMQEAIVIDHHKKEGEWWLRLEGNEYPSCGQVIYELATLLNLKTNSFFNEMVFVAIWTDTDGMVSRSISDETKRIMSSILNEDEKKDVIKKMELTEKEKNIVSQVLASNVEEDGVNVLISNIEINIDLYRIITALIIKQKAKKATFIALKYNDIYRCGLRSVNPIYDVSIFAQTMGGGGHKTSSGFTLKHESEIEVTKRKFIEYINKINT